MGYICSWRNRCKCLARSFYFSFFPPPPLSVSGRPLSSSCVLPPTDRVHGSHAERWALAFLDGLALQQGSIVTSHSSGSLEQHRIQLKDLVSCRGKNLFKDILMCLPPPPNNAGKHDDALHVEHEPRRLRRQL